MTGFRAADGSLLADDFVGEHKGDGRRVEGLMERDMDEIILEKAVLWRTVFFCFVS